MKPVMLIPVLLLAACSNTKALYFGTYTRIGIDASTDGAGVGVRNAALNITPTKKDGSAFDVLGTTDMDLGYTYAIVAEMLAVGQAARCAAEISQAASRDALLQEAGTPAVGPVIFGAYTSWSLLDLSWGNAAAAGINFGYKRGVGVRMPVVNDKVGSVFAHVLTNTTDDTSIAPKSSKGGTRYRHTFATGEAAVIKAASMARELNGGDSRYAGCL